MRKNRFEIMFGKCFFVFVFKNLLLRIKLKNNFLCFFIKKKKTVWLLERIKQFSNNKNKIKSVKYGCIFSLTMTSLVRV